MWVGYVVCCDLVYIVGLVVVRVVLNRVGYLWLFIKCFPVYLSCLFVALIVLWVDYWLCFLVVYGYVRFV